MLNAGKVGFAFMFLLPFSINFSRDQALSFSGSRGTREGIEDPRHTKMLRCRSATSLVVEEVDYERMEAGSFSRLYPYHHCLSQTLTSHLPQTGPGLEDAAVDDHGEAASAARLVEAVEADEAGRRRMAIEEPIVSKREKLGLIPTTRDGLMSLRSPSSRF